MIKLERRKPKGAAAQKLKRKKREGESSSTPEEPAKRPDPCCGTSLEISVGFGGSALVASVVVAAISFKFLQPLDIKAYYILIFLCHLI